MEYEGCRDIILSGDARFDLVDCVREKVTSRGELAETAKLSGERDRRRAIGQDWRRPQVQIKKFIEEAFAADQVSFGRAQPDQPGQGDERFRISAAFGFSQLLYPHLLLRYAITTNRGISQRPGTSQQ